MSIQMGHTSIKMQKNKHRIQLKLDLQKYANTLNFIIRDTNHKWLFKMLS